MDGKVANGSECVLDSKHTVLFSFLFFELIWIAHSYCWRYFLFTDKRGNKCRSLTELDRKLPFTSCSSSAHKRKKVGSAFMFHLQPVIQFEVGLRSVKQRVYLDLSLSWERWLSPVCLRQSQAINVILVSCLYIFISGSQWHTPLTPLLGSFTCAVISVCNVFLFI